MSGVLKNYENEKRQLLDIYSSLEEQGFIPSEYKGRTTEKEDIEEYKRELEDEKFVVSVCGQVNSGKSFFLNYFAFDGSQFLPVDVTPCTAKLAKITYSGLEGVDYAKIHFYNTKEWDYLKNLKIKDISNRGAEALYFEKYLQDDVNNSAVKGIYWSEYIKDESLTVNVENLVELSDYLAGDGKYSPFVSYAEIFVGNTELENIEFVDTPGLNDPNEIRSKITEEWIDKSNAVIMLIYSGRPLDISDYDFIDRYLACIPSEKILFALSKVDLQDGYEAACRYIEEVLKKDERLKKRRLIEHNSIYPISVMAATIKWKDDNGHPLSDDEIYYKSRMNNAIIERNGYMDDFCLAVENSIMQEKGSGIIKSNATKIIDICDRRINQIEFEILKYEDRLQSLNMSKDERKNKIKEIKDIRRNLETVKANAAERARETALEYSNEIVKIVETKATKIKKDEKRSIEVGNLVETSRFIIPNLKEDIKKMVLDLDENSTSSEFEYKVRQEIKKYIEQIEKLIPEKYPDLSTGKMFVFDIKEMIEIGQRKLRDDFLNFKEVKRLRWIWNDPEKKADLINCMCRIVDEAVKDFEVSMKGMIDKRIDYIIEKHIERTHDYLNLAEENIKNIEKEADRVKDEMEEVTENIEETKENLKSLKEKKLSIFGLLNKLKNAKIEGYTNG